MIAIWYGIYLQYDTRIWLQDDAPYFAKLTEVNGWNLWVMVYIHTPK